MGDPNGRKPINAVALSALEAGVEGGRSGRISIIDSRVLALVGGAKGPAAGDQGRREAFATHCSADCFFLLLNIW